MFVIFNWFKDNFISDNWHNFIDMFLVTGQNSRFRFNSTKHLKWQRDNDSLVSKMALFLMLIYYLNIVLKREALPKIQTYKWRSNCPTLNNRVAVRSTDMTNLTSVQRTKRLLFNLVNLPSFMGLHIEESYSYILSLRLHCSNKSEWQVAINSHG